MYENYYLHIFNNTSRLIKVCDERGISDFAAVLRVVQAYATANATDAYGPIAYSSVIESNGSTFAYDTQEEIYNQIFKLLNNAIASKPARSNAAAISIWLLSCISSKI